MPFGVTALPNRGGSGGEKYRLYFNFPGHANRREGIFKAIHRQDSVGGLNINVASNSRVWLSSEKRRDGDFFPPVGSFPTRVYVLRTGTYRITYSVNALTGAATAASVKTFLSKNGAGAVLDGSMSGMVVSATANLHGCARASILYDVTSGDYFEIFAIREGVPAGALNTIANGSAMTIELVSMPSETTLGGKQVILRPSQLTKVTLTKGVSGYSGTTYVRVLKNGLSIMGSNDLAITSANQFADFPQSVFATTRFDVGDVLSLDVISEEAPYPRDLSAIMLLQATNG